MKLSWLTTDLYLKSNGKLLKTNKMAVNKVEIYVSQILEDLDNGLTWLKRDDLGYGSIQDKYTAKDQQIAMIRKHPALKNAETTVTVFTVIDDTKKEEVVVSVDNTPFIETKPELQTLVQQPSSSDDELSAFANL
jgi:hypothetical protein